MTGTHPVSTIYLGIPTEAVKKPGMFRELVSSTAVRMSAVLTGTAAVPTCLILAHPLVKSLVTASLSHLHVSWLFF